MKSASRQSRPSSRPSQLQSTASSHVSSSRMDPMSKYTTAAASTGITGIMSHHSNNITGLSSLSNAAKTESSTVTWAPTPDQKCTEIDRIMAKIEQARFSIANVCVLIRITEPIFWTLKVRNQFPASSSTFQNSITCNNLPNRAGFVPWLAIDFHFKQLASNVIPNDNWFISLIRVKAEHQMHSNQLTWFQTFPCQMLLEVLEPFLHSWVKSMIFTSFSLIARTNFWWPGLLSLETTTQAYASL